MEKQIFGTDVFMKTCSRSLVAYVPPFECLSSAKSGRSVTREMHGAPQRMPDELLPDSDRLPSINGVPRFTRSLVRNRAHRILE